MGRSAPYRDCCVQLFTNFSTSFRCNGEKYCFIGLKNAIYIQTNLAHHLASVDESFDGAIHQYR